MPIAAALGAFALATGAAVAFVAWRKKRPKESAPAQAELATEMVESPLGSPARLDASLASGAITEQEYQQALQRPIIGSSVLPPTPLSNDAADETAIAASKLGEHGPRSDHSPSDSELDDAYPSGSTREPPGRPSL